MLLALFTLAHAQEVVYEGGKRGDIDGDGFKDKVDRCPEDPDHVDGCPKGALVRWFSCDGLKTAVRSGKVYVADWTTDDDDRVEMVQADLVAVTNDCVAQVGSFEQRGARWSRADYEVEIVRSDRKLSIAGRALASAPPPAPVAVAPKPAPAPAPAPVAKAPLPSVDGRLPTGKRAPNDAAVVIGFERYFTLPGVPYASRDAQAFHDLLVYTRGVPPDRVQLLTTGGVEHMRKAIEDAGRLAGPDGTVWVYFAGHGAASPESGERLLLGDDVRPDALSFSSRGLGVGEVERLATASGAKVLTVVDACFAGVGRGGGELLAGKRFAVPTYALTDTTGRAAQWNAASPNELSGPLDATEHGAFTYFAIGALRGWADGELTGTRDGKVTAEEANAYVQRALRSANVRDQRPVWTGDTGWVLVEGATETGPTF